MKTDTSKFHHKDYDMRKIITALALAAIVPATAYAQAPTATPKEDCCAKMKAEGKKCCCDDMEKGDHAGHDMKGMETPKK